MAGYCWSALCHLWWFHHVRRLNVLNMGAVSWPESGHAHYHTHDYPQCYDDAVPAGHTCASPTPAHVRHCHHCVRAHGALTALHRMPPLPPSTVHGNTQRRCNQQGVDCRTSAAVADIINTAGRTHNTTIRCTALSARVRGRPGTCAVSTAPRPGNRPSVHTTVRTRGRPGACLGTPQTPGSRQRPARRRRCRPPAAAAPLRTSPGARPRPHPQGTCGRAQRVPAGFGIINTCLYMNW